jgi:uncharacterized protein (TIGR03032 family)
MENKYDINYTPNLPEIMVENQFSVMITTYQAGKLIIIGCEDGKQLTQTPISLKKPMGIAIQGKKLAIACLDEIRFFSSEENIQDVINKSDGSSFDLAYAQRATYNTGILDVHDLEFGDGVIWGVNTLLSCLAVYDINFSFRAKWKPPFIDKLVPEDYCHLNGMAMENGLPKFVTALSQTSTKQGWRKDKMNSGVLMNVPEGEILVDGLAMPHSPRLYANKLYFLESGKGKLLSLDLKTNKLENEFDFNCFVRGLSFFGNLALIGKSKIRETSKDFADLKVKEGSQNAGLLFYDVLNKKIIGELNYTNSVEEIFDVKIIQNAKNPIIVTNEIDKYSSIMTFPGNKFWRTDENAELS